MPKHHSVLILLLLALALVALQGPVVSIGKDPTEMYKVLILGTQEPEYLSDAVALGDRIYAVGLWSRGTMIVSASSDLSSVEVYSYGPAACRSIEAVDGEIRLVCQGPVIAYFNPSTFYLEDYAIPVTSSEYLAGSEHMLGDHHVVYMNVYENTITIAPCRGTENTALDIGLRDYSRFGTLWDIATSRDFSCIVTNKYIIVLNSSYVPQYVLEAPQNIEFRSAAFLDASTLLIAADHPMGVLLIRLDVASGRTVATYVIPSTSECNLDVYRVRVFGAIVAVAGEVYGRCAHNGYDGFVALMTVDGKALGFLDIGSENQNDAINAVIVTKSGIVAVGHTFASNSSAIGVRKLDLKIVRGSTIPLSRAEFATARRTLPESPKPYGGMMTIVTDLVTRSQSLKNMNALMVYIPWGYIDILGVENLVPTIINPSTQQSQTEVSSTATETLIRTTTVTREITKTVTAIVTVPLIRVYTTTTTVTLPEKVRTVTSRITETLIHTRTVVIPVTTTIIKAARSTATLTKLVTRYITETTRVTKYLITKTVTETTTSSVTTLKTIEITSIKYLYREPSPLTIAIAIALIAIGIAIAFRRR